MGRALQQVCADNHKMLEAHKEFRGIISGESRFTPKLTVDNNKTTTPDKTPAENKTNDKENENSSTKIDDKQEAGLFLWHEWPQVDSDVDHIPILSKNGKTSPANLLTNQLYLDSCQKYQQISIDNAILYNTNLFKIVVYLSNDDQLEMNIDFIPYDVCFRHCTVQEKDDKSKSLLKNDEEEDEEEEEDDDEEDEDEEENEEEDEEDQDEEDDEEIDDEAEDEQEIEDEEENENEND